MFIRDELIKERLEIPLKVGDTVMLMESSYASEALGLRLGTVYLISKVRVSKYNGDEMVLIDGVNHTRWVQGKTFN